MAWLYFLVLGPVAAGIVLAIIWWLTGGRYNGMLGGNLRAFTLAAGLLLVLTSIAIRMITGPLSFVLRFPSEYWEWQQHFRFTEPLLLGILGLVLLAFPARARSGRGAADLTPRTPVSFASKRWFVAPAVLLTVTLIITLVAGAASQPDSETGHYTMYFVELGGERGMGTNIYGWYSSIPSMVLLGLMIALTFLVLFFIARPPLDDDRDRDVEIRKIRTRNVLAIGTGALLFHLGLIFSSLAGTASIRGTFSTSEGPVSSWTTFAALQPALMGASSIAAALGFALWSAVVVSAIASHRRAPVTVGS